MLGRIITFIIINFIGVGLGGIFTKSGVTSTWYTNLNQAPWTPPGWVFGAAWTVIMLSFAVFMAYRLKNSSHKKILLLLFSLQWLLNFVWNPVFFKMHAIGLGFIIISSLTVLVGYFLFNGLAKISWKSLYILPYFIWILIATSLNAYILIKN